MTYDVSAHIEAIKTFGTKAVSLPAFTPLRARTLIVWPVLPLIIYGSLRVRCAGSQGKGDQGTYRCGAEGPPGNTGQHRKGASFRHVPIKSVAFVARTDCY